MKVTKNHYKIILGVFTKFKTDIDEIGKYTISDYAEHAKANAVKSWVNYLVWRIWNSSKIDGVRTCRYFRSEGMNPVIVADYLDSHIETALKKAFKETFGDELN